MALKSCSSSVHVTSLQDFENDLCEFNQRVEDLDRRLGTVFSQAFDDAPDLEHAFKVCAGGGGGCCAPFSPHSQHRRARILFPLFCSLQRAIVPVSSVEGYCG